MPWGENNKGPWGGGQPSQKDPVDFEALLEKGKRYFQQFTGGGSNKGQTAVALALFLAVWLASGVYIVVPEEQGVITRFGAFNRIADPGLNYHLPAPVERVHKVPFTTINRVQVGLRSFGAPGKGKGQRVPEESLMLTGDENIVDVNFEVQWKVNDAAKFLFAVKDPMETVKSAAESAMREVVGRTPIAYVMTEDRSEIEDHTMQIIQTILNNYNAGIEVVRLQMGEVQPPVAVIDAFRDVQTARADRERARNEAETYRNDIIPRARGEAERIIQESEAYKQRVVAGAKGDAERFLSVYNKYKDAKDVTRKRLYLETMEQVLKGVNKVLIDQSGKGQGVIPYMPLPELKPKQQAVQP